MHDHIINAAIQIVPVLSSSDKHPYQWVDEAIAVIHGSGLKYEVGAFATTVEGKYDEVMQLVNDINHFLQEKSCAEWICNVQLQVRCSSDITAEEKVSKFK